MGEKKAEVPVGKELVRMTGIMKEFPGVKALDNVKLDLYAGEVLALLGENGAGKSTLMKILSGVYQRDDGEIILFGNKIGEWDANKAKNAGVSSIHQELNMCTHLSVAENIFLGRELIKNGRLDNERMNQETKEILHKLNIDIDPREQVSELAVSKQQMVEIAKALSQNAKVLIMDEPTSALTSKEIDELFKIIHQLKSEGIGIIYISHRLEEIMEIGDHVTILRDGRYVADADVRDIDVPWIVKQMTGEGKSYPKKDRNIDWEKQETVLEVRDLTLPKSGGGYLLHHVDFNLKRGEILGIYGLMGAGRTEVFECIMGLRPEHTGDILLEGKKMEIHSISEQIERGFALVPEDRQREGLVQTMSILKNISLSSIKKYVKGFLLDDKLEGRRADEQIKDIHIKVADKNLPILSLSGGNQQKVVIGKGLLTNPKILLLDEPSRGIDIGAKTEVFDIINQYAEKGLSIIVISSELKEIIAIADRVMVLSNGIKTGELIGDEIQEESLVLSSYKGHHGQ